LIEGNNFLYIKDVIIGVLNVGRVSIEYAENVEDTVGSSVVLIHRMNKCDNLKRN
jgi:hypothetical protein